MDECLPRQGFAAPGRWSGDLKQKAEGVSAKKWSIEVVKHSVRHPLDRLHCPTIRHNAARDKHDLQVRPVLGLVCKLGVDPCKPFHSTQGGERPSTIGNVLQHAWDVKETRLPYAHLRINRYYYEMLISLLYLRDCSSNKCHRTIMVLQVGANWKISKNGNAKLFQVWRRPNPAQHEQLEIERSVISEQPILPRTCGVLRAPALITTSLSAKTVYTFPSRLGKKMCRPTKENHLA